MSDQAIIPTIDISSFRQDPSSAEAKQVVEQFRQACTTYGFLQIVGHGVSRDLQDAVLQGAVAFFALPMEEKKKLVRARGKGYEAFKTQEQSRGIGGDLKEGFYLSADLPWSHPLVVANEYFVGPNKWPPEDVLSYSVFKDPVDTYYAEMLRVAQTMFKIVAAGMPYGPDVFSEFTGGVPLAILSPKHYPPSLDEGFGCNPHTDHGAITLLLQDKHSGLQVKHGEQWIDVKPNPEAYVVNIGDMLQGLTRGQYKSTLHRVLKPEGNVHRYSLPFFFNGNLDYLLVPLDGLRDTERAVTVREHMLERIRRTLLKQYPDLDKMAVSGNQFSAVLA